MQLALLLNKDKCKMLYSSELSINTKDLSIPVQNCIRDIEVYFNIKKATVLMYDEFSIVVPVNINVSLPPHGPVDEIDIRPLEPVLIKIFISLYPYIIPFAMSDRKDFPKDRLSHLYVSKKEEPARLCLVRNDPSEWFADKKMSDYLHVVEEWFFKAAAGLLNEDGNEFDPIRLEGYNGQHIYKYQTLFDIVNNDQRCVKTCSFAIILGSVKNDGTSEDKTITYRSLHAIPYLQIQQILDAFKKISQTVDLNTTPEKPIFSILVWPPELEEDGSYWTELPKDYKTLKNILNNKNIDIDKILGFYVDNGLQLINGIPVILALKRPTKMIGYNGNIEFINLGISAGNFGKKMADDVTVYNLQHIEPFSKELAVTVSGQMREKNILFIGAGSLGSKMIIHEARSGNFNISIVDDDKLLQHNLVRHALYNNRMGKNKAIALKEEIESFIRVDNQTKLKAFDKKIMQLTQADFVDINWIVDTTASVNVQNWISKNELPDMCIARCELADDTKLGLTYIEGINRNPRIDDLVNLTYYLALKNKDIEEWRLNDSNKELTSLNIGLGCSSTSTVAPDDLISMHSALFSQVLYNERDRKNIKDNGLIFISKLSDIGMINVKSESVIVEPFVILACGNKTNWEIRMEKKTSDKIFSLVKQAGRNETGGVLIGVANYKTFTIHILDIVKATIDSKGTPGRFKRGIKNLPEQINEVKKRTGNMVGYIGEWHSHPMGLDQLSTIDLDNIDVLKAENDKVPIPTCAIIISNGKILPFIFD